MGGMGTSQSTRINPSYWLPYLVVVAQRFLSSIRYVFNMRQQVKLLWGVLRAEFVC